MYKGLAAKVILIVRDKTTLLGITGDSDNISVTVIADGEYIGASSNLVSEVSSSVPGVYSILLTAAEMNHNTITLIARTTTQNAVIEPVTINTISIEELYDAINNGSLDGRVEWNYQYTDIHGPVDGAYVKIFTEWDCINCISGAYTNAQGYARFWLVPGTYYVVVLKNGHDVFGPDEEVVE